MRFFVVTIFFLVISISPIFAQIEKINKKSEENKENNKTEETRKQGNEFSSNSSNNACADACFGCFTDIFVQMLIQHQGHLWENKDKYPNLFGIQTDALASLFPSNDIFAITPNYQANIGIIGIQGSYYRMFQPKFGDSYYVFTAADYYITFNLGLFEGHSIMAGYGALSDINSKESFGAFLFSYNAFFGDYKNSIELNYKQSDDYLEDVGIPYINAHVLFRRQLLKVGVLKISGVAGFKYQRFYGEDLMFISGGINFELF